MGLDKMQTLFTSIYTQRSTKELVNCVYEQKSSKVRLCPNKVTLRLAQIGTVVSKRLKTKPQQLNYIFRGRCVFLITSADIIHICNNCIISFACIKFSKITLFFSHAVYTFTELITKLKPSQPSWQIHWLLLFYYSYFQLFCLDWL